MFLKSVFLTQQDRYVEAAGMASIIIKTFKKPKFEAYLPACATFELGNSLRLQGKNIWAFRSERGQIL